MKNSVYLSLIYLLCPFILSAQPFLTTPIDGEYGTDWVIVNHVDWDTIGFKDHHCGTKSYDGHQGTDLTIKSFKQMDAGVNVLAAADGTVTYFQDGAFDRETAGDVSKGLGNYIAIRHDNDYYSYYGHLKTNSIIVNVGDKVNAGDIIGQVGSSGNSTDPHLHFELWYDSIYVVDPFMGPCGNPTSLFTNPEPYDTTLIFLESGILSQSNLGINDLRERVSSHTRPYELKSNSNFDLNFWAHLHGVRKGKELTLKWFTPNGIEWFDYTITLDQDYWYYYYWSYINHTDLEFGTWDVKLYYDGELIVEEDFTVKNISSNDDKSDSDFCDQVQQSSINELLNDPQIVFKIYDLTGSLLSPSDIGQLPQGLYLIQIVQGDHRCIQKKYLGIER